MSYVKQTKDWGSRTPEQNITLSPRNLRQLSISTAHIFDISIIPADLGIWTWVRALEWVQDSPLQSLALYKMPLVAPGMPARDSRGSSHDNMNKMVELVLAHCRRPSVSERLRKLIVSGTVLDADVIERILNSGTSLEYLGTKILNSNLVSCAARCLVTARCNAQLTIPVVYIRPG